MTVMHKLWGTMEETKKSPSLHMRKYFCEVAFHELSYLIFNIRKH